MRRIALAVVPLAALAAVVAFSARGGPERSQLRIVRVASGLTEPVAVTAPRNEPNNVYVVEKVGRIRVIVRTAGSVRGRSSTFARSSSTTASRDSSGSRSARSTRRTGTSTSTTPIATATRASSSTSRAGCRASRRKLRQIFFQNDPYPNHNGGNLVFGPDGYLYTGTGDGGSGGDPQNRAQNLKSTFGKLLKFNVTRKRPQPLIVGYGLRNPWRFSFDRQTGDLYIGDVGQDAWEELDYTKRGTPGIENYGWRVYEGKSRYTPGQTPNAAGHLVFPYLDASTSAVLLRHRRLRLPGDARCRLPAGGTSSATTATTRSRASPRGGGTRARVEPFTVDGLAVFGEDARGELYLASVQSGNVYRLAG